MDERKAFRSPLLAAAALSSGAALVAAVVFRLSLALTLSASALVTGVLMAIRIAQLSGSVRARLRADAATGATIGIVATVAYDVSRVLIVALGHLHFRPFETFVLFGYAILGASASRTSALAVGTLYHYLNGISFAVGYRFLLGGRPWPVGVAWALGLEAAMFALYPGWLDLRAVMVEFTIVSLSGHLAYGATLGLLDERWSRAQARVARGGA